jgi:hypothetical protein
MHPMHRPPPAKRSPGAAVLFHVGGLVACVVGSVAGYVLAVIGLFVGLACNDEGNPPTDLTVLRVWMFFAGLALAAVPGAWAGIAKLARFSWKGWAAFSVVLALVTVWVALTTTFGGESTCWGNSF